MRIAYWIIASLYLYAGAIKVGHTKDQLRPMMGWIDTVPLRLVRLIGTLEVLGAIGLILPPLTGVATGFALAAAIGLVAVQIGAISLHVSRGEVNVIGFNVALLVLAAVAMWLSMTWL